MDYIPSDHVTIHKTYLNSRRKSNTGRFIWTSSEYLEVLALQYIQTTYMCTYVPKGHVGGWGNKELLFSRCNYLLFLGSQWVLLKLESLLTGYKPDFQIEEAVRRVTSRESWDRWWHTGLRERPPSLAGSLLQRVHANSTRRQEPTGLICGTSSQPQIC